MVNKTWMLYRLEYVLGAVYRSEIGKDGRHHRVTIGHKDTLTTTEVRNALKVCEGVLRFWTRDPHFLRNEIAVKTGHTWAWNRQRTIQWVIAAMKLDLADLPVRPERDNPPGRDVPEVTIGMNWKRARKALGIPIDHLWRGRPKSPEAEIDEPPGDML